MTEGADLPCGFSHKVLLRRLTPVFLQRDTGVFYGGFFGQGVCELGIPDEQQGLGQLVSQAGRKVGVPESVSTGFQLLGNDPGSIDDQCLTHFTIEGIQGEGGNSRCDRPAQLGGEDGREVFIANGSRGGAIDGAAQLIVPKDPQDDLQKIIEVDPAHPLAST